jgi:hypothetical protein
MTINKKMKYIEGLKDSGKLVVTKESLFGDDFQLPDKSFSFKFKRRGGGFTQGTDAFEIIRDGQTILTADFNKAINLTYEYLNEKI